MLALDREDYIPFQPTAGESFVETPFIKRILDRALIYLKAGFPVHFRGIAGTGKTTLALRVSELIERPVIMVHGDEEMTTSNLVGEERGYHLRSLRDNFIHSVLKVEEEATAQWTDNRLTIAVENGYTLIYDEFTRSHPEANNIFLSVLQERVLDIPMNRGDGKSTLIKVHPEFRVIFTSNPEEYAGVYGAPDALRDRMVTLDLEVPDEETECAITSRKSGLDPEVAHSIVKVVRYFREHGNCEFAPTVRGSIIIARVVKSYGRNIVVNHRDQLFTGICCDILTSESSRTGKAQDREKLKMIIISAIKEYCNHSSNQSGLKIVAGGLTEERSKNV